MADIQLSSQLFQDIQDAVTRQHADADAGTVMQYLAAVMGYMLGNQRQMPDQQKQAYMDELCGFAKHVLDDLMRSQQQQQQQQAAAADAFGIWEPSK